MQVSAKHFNFAENDLIMECNFKLNDNVFVSPNLTHYADWEPAKIIDIETDNPYNGIVISAKLDCDGDIFFGRKENFKKTN